MIAVLLPSQHHGLCNETMLHRGNADVIVKIQEALLIQGDFLVYKVNSGQSE